ncbi:MAG TPA: 2-phospho-L-lactate transferase [Pyrinomonadaceae bacterium]|nr:2-phospho-L-lactate transferase [Pyrinomonadaceae bacterium]
MKITALAGGVGASKFLDGLSRVTGPEELTVIVNTGDDIELFGLYVAPDLDIVTYTLAGVVNPETGWGVSGDTFECLGALSRYGADQWFALGDRDLATHVYRTWQMRRGATLTEVADHVRRSLGVRARILPMTDTHTPTTILTDEGPLHFQEYFVKRRAQIEVRGLRFENVERARPAPGVAEAILGADAVVICPSNPLISIGPILAVPGMRALLARTPATVAAVSPLVAGASLKGPTDRMMAELGMEVSAAQVARMYAGLLDLFVLDERDAHAAEEVRRAGVEVLVTQTVMRDLAAKVSLAEAVLGALADAIPAHPR